MLLTKNYDSDFCGSLPLSHINVIQSYGYLIVLNKDDLKVIQLSENVNELIGKNVQEIVDTPLADYTDQGGLENLSQKFKSPIKDKVPVKLSLNGHPMLALAHLKDSYIIVELEHNNEQEERSFTNVFEEVKLAMAAINAAGSVEEISKVAINELKKLSGFDGIMMYRFDKDWNGTVIAEVKEPGMDNYLGHTFPASDIPKQARELYIRNPYRLIPDIDYKPIRLYPVVNPGTRTFIDLSDCNLRGVAAVHLEYLRNMNVQASMSIRVMTNDGLWGLIACHHRNSRFLNFEVCSVFELLSSVVSNQINSILYKEDLDMETELQRQRTAIMAQVYDSNDLADGLLDENGSNLMGLFNAGGVTLTYNNIMRTAGQTPPADFTDDLILWLQTKDIDKVFSATQLSEQFEEAADYAQVASGILVISIDKERGDYVICYRPEVVQTISWGGDPNKAINFEPDGKNYHPRNSFKVWMETVRNASLPWNRHELKAAEELRSFIYEFRSRQ